MVGRTSYVKEERRMNSGQTHLSRSGRRTKASAISASIGKRGLKKNTVDSSSKVLLPAA